MVLFVYTANKWWISGGGGGGGGGGGEHTKIKLKIHNMCYIS